MAIVISFPSQHTNRPGRRERPGRAERRAQLIEEMYWAVYTDRDRLHVAIWEALAELRAATREEDRR